MRLGLNFMKLWVARRGLNVRLRWVWARHSNSHTHTHTLTHSRLQSPHSTHTHHINVLCIANLLAAGSDPVEMLPNYARKLCVRKRKFPQTNSHCEYCAYDMCLAYLNGAHAGRHIEVGGCIVISPIYRSL